MLCGSNVAVILYCLFKFSYFSVYFMKLISYVANCQIFMFQFNAMKLSFHEQ